MVKSSILFLIFLSFSSISWGSENRFMIFLSDKAASDFSIENPAEFLSERAIQRREKQGIPITNEDLPVSEVYVDEISALGAEVYFRSKWMNALLVQMDSAFLGDIEELPFVDSIQYIAKGSRLSREQSTFEIPETFETPTSIIATTDLQLSMMNAHVMHEDGYRGEGMYVAVLDAGFPGVNQFKPFEHIHRENRLIAYRDFVTNSNNPFLYSSAASAHGTSVLSTIAMDYGEEIQGVAPKAGFVLCITEDIASEYRIEEYNWLLGAEFADSVGVDVINGSLGYSTFSDSTMNYSQQQLDGETAVVTWAATRAAAKGMVVVVSGGNSGNKAWKYVTPPGDAEGILVVGSVNPDGQRASFSSLGPTSDGRIKPDVMALGSPATVFDGPGFPDRITLGSGTSYSSPQIAGLAAAVWQANPEWTNQQVIDAIKFSGNLAFEPNVELGHGIPDYRFAVTDNLLSVSDILEEKIKVYPNPFHDGKINIDLSGIKKDRFLDLTITNIKGASLINQRIDLKNGITEYQVDFPAVDNGIYLLSVSSKSYNKTIKLIKY